VDIRSLLPLQSCDARLAQLAHRKAQLPERPLTDAAATALSSAGGEVTRTEKRLAAIAGEVERLEKQGKELDAKKSKYEAQLKSVIAMREVEALQHEISGVNAQHSLLDDAELVLLEESETLGRSLAELRSRMPSLEAAASAAAGALASAVALVDGDIAAMNDERARVVAGIDPTSLALYEQIRARMSGAAVAEIMKGSCGGCHTAISPKEQAELRNVADTPDARCPYCGCLLAV
jgi:hypothetical protein